MANRLNLSDDSSDAIYNAITSNSKSKSPFDFNILEYFYNKHNIHPFIYTISSDNMYYNWDNIKKSLNSEYTTGMDILYSSFINNIDDNKCTENVKVMELMDGIVLTVKCVDTDSIFFDDLIIDDNDTLLNDATILTVGEIDKTQLVKINKIFKDNKVDSEEKVSIGMVSMVDGEYYVKDFDISDSILNLSELDMHYGEGFSDFNDKLVERMLKASKGLVLFHGNPGSGKTTYVRHLLKTIQTENNKNNILYFPPSMVDAVTDPVFIDFISDWACNTEAKNYLLIEDAEPLLESRDQTRNMGITNLLNMTDGLLNDILNLQIIATFNTDLKNIDKALLRPERLLGRKNFRNLNTTNAKILADKIGADISNTSGDISLAEIYALKNKTDILIHDIEETVSKIGFK